MNQKSKQTIEPTRFSVAGPKVPTAKISEKLEIAYASLRNRYTGMNLELEETNVKLVNKVIELDFLTQYLNSILSNITQGILFINTNGVVTTYNPAAEHILKKPSHHVLFQDFGKSFPDDIFSFSMSQALKNEKAPGTLFSSHEFKKGNPRELEVDTSFITKTNLQKSSDDTEELDSLEGLIVLVRDVTEFRNLEMIVQRKNRMNDLGEMASMVAHEIRNPLGGIKGFASLLERDLKDHAELQKMATFIIQGTDNLNNLVSRVLDYSRPLQIQFKMINLVTLVKDLKQHVMTDENINDKAELIIDYNEESIKAPINSEFLRSALLNLTLNAIQAMPKGGTVTIKLSKGISFAMIELQDNGIGIPSENLRKIFSPFFTTKPDGNGFGLSEVHKVIQAHEGSIDVKSVEEQGTTFTIKLPLKRLG